MLPPALGPRLDRADADDGAEAAPQPVADAVAVTEAVPAPRRRGRPRKNPLPEASTPESSTEVVDG
jgi:hypothetical protein